MEVKPSEWATLAVAALVAGVSAWVALATIFPPPPVLPEIKVNPSDPPCAEESAKSAAEMERLKAELGHLADVRRRIEEAEGGPRTSAP